MIREETNWWVSREIESRSSSGTGKDRERDMQKADRDEDEEEFLEDTRPTNEPLYLIAKENSNCQGLL